MWHWAVWSALIAGALAGVAGLVLLGMRARDGWSAFKETRRSVVRQVDDLVLMAEETADKVLTAGETTELSESVGRLRLSLARLAVLRAAIDEAQDVFDRFTAVVPRK
jgi:hypothetical protein